MILGVLGIVLQEFGYEVRLLDDARIALDLIKRSPPDLILLDIIMPKKDGTELLNEIRKINPHSKIPIILISGSYKIKEIAKEYNTNAYLEKPIDIDKLRSVIENHFA